MGSLSILGLGGNADCEEATSATGVGTIGAGEAAYKSDKGVSVSRRDPPEARAGDGVVVAVVDVGVIEEKALGKVGVSIAEEGRGEPVSEVLDAVSESDGTSDGAENPEARDESALVASVALVSIAPTDTQVPASAMSQWEPGAPCVLFVSAASAAALSSGGDARTGRTAVGRGGRGANGGSPVLCCVSEGNSALDCSVASSSIAGDRLKPSPSVRLTILPILLGPSIGSNANPVTEPAADPEANPEVRPET